MSHKVHPKSFRLKELADWRSRWLNLKKFPEYLEEDFKIRKFLEKKLKEASIQEIEIERFPRRVNIIIHTVRPGLVIGRGGTGAEELKKALEKHLVEKKEIRIEIREIKNPWANAVFVAQSIAQQLEKRMPYRRTLKQTLDKVATTKEVAGARVEVAGRLDGNEIARTEWFKKGRLPRQTIRSDIDYAKAEARCSYGVIGVKVWIYKGEKF